MQTRTLGRGTGKSQVRVRVALSQPAGYPCSCLAVAAMTHCVKFADLLMEEEREEKEKTLTMRITLTTQTVLPSLNT